MRQPALTAILATALIAGCGGDTGDEGDSTGPVAEGSPDVEALVSRLPAGHPDARRGIYIDLALARRQLGLPEDADPSLESGEEGPDAKAELRLAFAAPYAVSFISPLLTDVPVGSAIDGGSIAAAASNGNLGPAGVNVLRTSQPFEEIEDSLAADGYERRGELLVSEEELSSIVYRAVADAGDGLVVLAGSEEAAQAALDAPEEVTDFRRRLLELPGAQRSVADRADGSCLDSIDVWTNFVPAEGEIIFGVDGNASSKAVTIDEYSPLGPDVERPVADFSDAEDEGSFARVPYEYDPSLPANPVLQLLAGDIPLDEIYDCG